MVKLIFKDLYIYSINGLNGWICFHHEEQKIKPAKLSGDFIINCTDENRTRNTLKCSYKGRDFVPKFIDYNWHKGQTICLEYKE